MLATIENAGDGFRVSSSGTVQGFGQCVGDLSPSDCSSCLSEGVKQLKTVCGQAAAAHVFLAKCYAEYWEAGYDDLSSHSSGTCCIKYSFVAYILITSKYRC